MEIFRYTAVNSAANKALVPMPERLVVLRGKCGGGTAQLRRYMPED